MFFIRKRKIAAFNADLERWKSLGRIIEANEADFWFTSLGGVLEELPANVGDVLYVHTVDHGVACRVQLVYSTTTRSLFIGDITSKPENKGFGSIAMKSVLYIAEKLDVNEVHGNLAVADKDHFDKLEHFYGKHGFDVMFDDSRTSGKISLKLNEN